MRTKEERINDAKVLLKRLNKYTGSGLYMLKHGSDVEDDDLMLQLAQELIKGIQRMATTEVCRMDEDEIISDTVSYSNPKVSDIDNDLMLKKLYHIDDNRIALWNRLRTECMNSRTAIPTYKRLELDRAMLDFLDDKLCGNEREGVTVTMHELATHFDSWLNDELDDSIKRLLSGYYETDDGERMYAIEGWINLNKDGSFHSLYYTKLLWDIEDYKDLMKYPKEIFNGVD